MRRPDNPEKRGRARVDVGRRIPGHEPDAGAMGNEAYGAADAVKARNTMLWNGRGCDPVYHPRSGIFSRRNPDVRGSVDPAPYDGPEVMS